VKQQGDNLTVDAILAETRRGRPVTGNAKTNAQRQAEWRERRRSAGLSPRTVWVDRVTSNDMFHAELNVTDNANLLMLDDAKRRIDKLSRELNEAALANSHLMQQLLEEKKRSDYLLVELKAERKRVVGLRGQLAKVKTVTVTP